MSPEEKEHAIRQLMEEIKCTQNQASNALILARGNKEIARTIIKEYNSATKTTYAGGVSGQIVETPKSEYADEFKKLMEHSKNNQGQEATASKTLIVYKNGIVIEDKFTRLKENERDAMIKKISETGEVPSHLFGIKQGDFIDVEMSMRLDEIYKEEYPGDAHTVSLSVPVETGDKIELGSSEIVFKLVIQNKVVTVQMGNCTDFSSLIEYLKKKNISGNLKCNGQIISLADPPAKYNRSRIILD